MTKVRARAALAALAIGLLWVGMGGAQASSSSVPRLSPDVHILRYSVRERGIIKKLDTEPCFAGFFEYVPVPSTAIKEPRVRCRRWGKCSNVRIHQTRDDSIHVSGPSSQGLRINWLGRQFATGHKPREELVNYSGRFPGILQPWLNRYPASLHSHGVGEIGEKVSSLDSFEALNTSSDGIARLDPQSKSRDKEKQGEGRNSEGRTGLNAFVVERNPSPNAYEDGCVTLIIFAGFMVSAGLGMLLVLR